MSHWQVMVSLSVQKEEGFCKWKYSSGLEPKYNVPQGKKGIPLQPLFDGTVSNYTSSELLNSQTLFFLSRIMFLKSLVKDVYGGREILNCFS